MGIFGGFKAKFTRNSRSKEYMEPIICTKYKINSEFEDDAPVVFKHNHRIRNLKSKISKQDEKELNQKYSRSLNDLRNSDEKSNKFEVSTPSPLRKTESTLNTSIRQAPSQLIQKRTEQEDQHEYEEPIASPTTSSAPSFDIEKPPKLPKNPPPSINTISYIVQNEYDEPNEKLYNTSTNNLYEQNSLLSEKNDDKQLKQFGDKKDHEILTVNSLYLDTSLDSGKLFSSKMTQDYEEISPGEKYKVTFPENDLEPSTLILMTQPSEDASNVPESPNSPIKSTELFQNEKEEDFKVNVVKYDYQMNYSVSDDELSTKEVDNEEMNSYMSTGYTSQAASIFFGVDLEQPKPQPRKMVLQKATSDEEDC